MVLPRMRTLKASRELCAAHPPKLNSRCCCSKDFVALGWAQVDRMPGQWGACHCWLVCRERHRYWMATMQAALLSSGVTMTTATRMRTRCHMRPGGMRSRVGVWLTPNVYVRSVARCQVGGCSVREECHANEKHKVRGRPRSLPCSGAPTRHWLTSSGCRLGAACWTRQHGPKHCACHGED